jgi:hypothetical protein
MEQALNSTNVAGFMGSYKPSSFCICLVEQYPLLYGGCWREDEVAHDDGKVGRSLWNQDFILNIEERF